MTQQTRWNPVKRIFVVLAVACLPSCGRSASVPGGAQADPVHLRMATTTSTDNSGLLDVLLPPFEKRYNVKVDVLAVGTGKALKLGETGDVDIVLVHARSAEDAFVERGFGVNRRDVMHNDFLLVGPEADPADVMGATSAKAALAAIAGAKTPFASRGDDSGTHKKEKQLWKAAGIAPAGPWYLETGQGMGATLTVADQKSGYCLVDRATFLAFREKIELVIVLQGDPTLFNPYGIIPVNPQRHAHAKYMEAMLLTAWVTSREGQKLIAGYQKHGQVLFHPDAVPVE